MHCFMPEQNYMCGYANEPSHRDDSFANSNICLGETYWKLIIKAMSFMLSLCMIFTEDF